MSLRRPSEGTKSRRVWNLADRLTAEFGRPAGRAEVCGHPEVSDILHKTVSTQYGAWKRASHPELSGRRYDPGNEEKHTGWPLNEVPPSGGKELLRDTEYKWDILLKNGFSYLGDWEEDGAGEMRLERQAPDAPGVYAFVVGEEVVYVGKTSRTLRARMADYRRGHYRQRTSAAVKRQIGEVLRQGTGVRVLVATPPDGLWNGLPIVTLHGLEAGLIQLLTPLWNRQGKG